MVTVSLIMSQNFPFMFRWYYWWYWWYNNLMDFIRININTELCSSNVKENFTEIAVLDMPFYNIR